MEKEITAEVIQRLVLIHFTVQFRVCIIQNLAD